MLTSPTRYLKLEYVLPSTSLSLDEGIRIFVRPMLYFAFYLCYYMILLTKPYWGSVASLAHHFCKYGPRRHSLTQSHSLDHARLAFVPEEWVYLVVCVWEEGEQGGAGLRGTTVLCAGVAVVTRVHTQATLFRDVGQTKVSVREQEKNLFMEKAILIKL